MEELVFEETESVSGGILNFFMGYAAGKALDAYGDWVSGGASGWKVVYHGQSFSDPLL